jgi:archaemetzincin
MKTPLLLLLPLLMMLLSCGGKAKDAAAEKSNNDHKHEQKKEQKPPAIRILPLGMTRHGQPERVEQQLKEVFQDVAILPARDMPKHARSKYRPRWRADTLLTWMKQQVPKGEVWIAVTIEDISHTEGSNPDYGIMGLGYRPGKACIVSDARLHINREKGFPKIVLHELGHTSGLDHCPDKSCTMQDAEGKNVTHHMQGFCKSCLSGLKAKGWKI